MRRIGKLLEDGDKGKMENWTTWHLSFKIAQTINFRLKPNIKYLKNQNQIKWIKGIKIIQFLFYEIKNTFKHSWNK